MPGRPGRSGGHNRKPTALKVMEGTARRDRINADEPEFPALLALDPPAWLDGLAQEHWGYYAPLLSASRVMTAADVSLLAAASERWSVYRRASKAMAGKTTATLIGRTRFHERTAKPEDGVAHRALADYVAIMREFGVGPASRGKVKSDKRADRDAFSEAFE